MIRQHSNHRVISIKNQCGDVKANILVLVAFILLAFLVWQYNQNNSDDTQQTTDPLVTIDENQASEESQPDIIDPLEQKSEEELENLDFQQADDYIDQQLAEQNQQGSPEEQLLALDESDDLVREEVAGLSGETTWLKWLSTSQTIRKFVQFSENLSRGQVPHKYFNFLAPNGSFKVKALDNNEYILDPQSYKRYDQFARTIDSFDTENLVNAYAMLKPYIDTAWDETKNTEQSFDEVLLKAINQIQSAPAIRHDVRLIRPTVMYKYADSNIEQLNNVSKQMIRMGPANTRIIQKKMDEIEQLLNNLDSTSVYEDSGQLQSYSQTEDDSVVKEE